MLKRGSCGVASRNGPGLERRLFHRRQLLASGDLGRVLTDNDERRFWHNRAIHDAYGVAVGLKLSWDGWQRPWISSGIAYDIYGRELVLRATPVIAPPAAERHGDADIVWSLLLRRRENGEGIGCPTEATNRGDSELVWRRGREVELDKGVVLTRGTWILNGEPDYLPEPGYRAPVANAYGGPRLAHGTTVSGGTDWKPWKRAIGQRYNFGRVTATIVSRGIEVTVDTSAAGFTRTPCYFASLQGGPWQNLFRFSVTTPVERITTTARDRFTYSLWDVDASQAGFFDSAALQAARERALRFLDLARRRLFVCWLAVEEPPNVGTYRPTVRKDTHDATGNCAR